jgi:hypothetical protein
MERRLKMMIAGSVAVWVPVASAAQATPAVADAAKLYRLKSESHSEANTCASP